MFRFRSCVVKLIKKKKTKQLSPPQKTFYYFASRLFICEMGEVIPDYLCSTYFEGKTTYVAVLSGLGAIGQLERWKFISIVESLRRNSAQHLDFTLIFH